MAICVVCGKKLTTTRKNVLYCSSTCRSRACRIRQKTERRAREVTMTLDGMALMQQLRKVLPSTAERLEKFITDHGVSCTEAAVKLCLSAYAEAQAGRGSVGA